MLHVHKNFTGRVVLDGDDFLGCQFTDVTFVYRGGPPPMMSRCVFDGVSMAFDGAAANTAAFLKLLASPQSGFQQVVRSTFPELATAH
jgi:hypothetical protein